MKRAGLALLAAVAALAFAGPVAAQQRVELGMRDEVRVCADPGNLPFSNQKREGFENRIAQIIADDLELPVSFVWFPQTVGFLRNTLSARQCDLVMGTISSDSLLETTSPYYHTAYMIVTRADDPAPPRSVGDPAMAGRRIGIIASTPPAGLLIKHDLMRQVEAYPLNVDTRQGIPARRMLQDLAEGRIDVALVWGPVVGYAIKQEGLPLRAELLPNEPDMPRLDYSISVGVRAGEPEWRRRVGQAVQRHQGEITALLRDYGVPLLDERGQPLPSP